MDLTRMQDTQELFMPETCQVVRWATVSDGMGGILSGASSGSSNVCRMGETSWKTQDGVMAEREGTAGSYFVTLPFGTDVVELDEIVVGVRRLKVVNVVRATFGTAVRALCMEMR